MSYGNSKVGSMVPTHYRRVDIDVTDVFDIVHFREWICLYHWTTDRC